MSNSEAQATQVSQPSATRSAEEAGVAPNNAINITDRRQLWENLQRMIGGVMKDFPSAVTILRKLNSRPSQLPVEKVNGWLMATTNIRHGSAESVFKWNSTLSFFAMNSDRMLVLNTKRQPHQSTILFLNVARDKNVHNRSSPNDVPCNVIFEGSMNDPEEKNAPPTQALEDSLQLAYILVPYAVRNNAEVNRRIAKRLEEEGADPEFVRSSTEGTVYAAPYSDRLAQFCSENHCYIMPEQAVTWPALYEKRTFVARMDDFENVAGKWQLKRSTEEKLRAVANVLRDNRVSGIWPVGQKVRVVLKTEATQDNFTSLNDDLRQALGASACMCEGFRPTWQKPSVAPMMQKPKAKDDDTLIEVHPVNNPVYVRQIASELADLFGAKLQRAALGYIVLRCESKQQRDNMESMLIIHRGVKFLATASCYGPLCETAKEALARNVAKRHGQAGPAPNQEGVPAAEQQ